MSDVILESEMKRARSGSDLLEFSGDIRFMAYEFCDTIPLRDQVFLVS